MIHSIGLLLISIFLSTLIASEASARDYYGAIAVSANELMDIRMINLPSATHKIERSANAEGAGVAVKWHSGSAMLAVFWR